MIPATVARLRYAPTLSPLLEELEEVLWFEAQGLRQYGQLFWAALRSQVSRHSAWRKFLHVLHALVRSLPVISSKQMEHSPSGSFSGSAAELLLEEGPADSSTGKPAAALLTA